MTFDSEIRELIVELMEDMPFDGFIIHNQGVVLEVNDKFCALFGLEKPKLIGQNFFDLKVLEQDSASTVREKMSLDFEGLYKMQGRRSNGEIFPIEVYVRQAKASGNGIRIAVVRDLTNIQHAESAVLQSDKNLSEALVNTVRVLSTTLEKRDPYTAGHQTKVAELAMAIGRKLEMSSDVVTGLEMGSLVHDLGKIAVPTDLLSKPTRLSPIEFNLIQTHSAQGYEVLKDLALPWPIARMAHEHHERLDGSGYPQGLVNGAICDEAKIIAVADMFEAISAHRPYRPALGMQFALAQISKHKGTQLDREIVDACTACVLEDDFSFSAAA